MKNLKLRLANLPPWTLTIITIAVILWMTLAPHPLGDEDIPLFPGADKLVHAIMFGGLTIVALLDITRRQRWRPVPARCLWFVAILASLLGVLIEICQWKMGLGRSFEWADIAADTAGAFLCALLWLSAAPRILH